MTKDITSSENHLKFVRLKAESYAGIHKDMNLMIVFDKDKNIIGIEGDQGTGKTSLLKLVEVLCGGEETVNSLNATDKNKSAELELIKDGINYSIRLTKTTFVITRIDADGSKSTIKSPKDFLRNNLIGQIGFNPMQLKSMKGNDQIKWLKDLVNFTQEQSKTEEEILSKRRIAYDVRTKINRTLKDKHDLLKNTPFYTWQEDNRTFIATAELQQAESVVANSETDEVKLQEEFKERDTANRERERRINDAIALERSVKQSEQRIKTIKEQIENLYKQREDEELHQILVAKEWHDAKNEIEQTKKVAILLEETKGKLFNLNATKEKKRAITDAKETYNKFNQLFEQHIQYSAQIAEYDNLHKEFIKSFIPAIDGLEIIVKSQIDGEDQEEGISYFKRTPAMLSESELLELSILLWEHKNVKVAIIENINSLGSDCIERINDFANNKGAYIFYSAMQRNVKKQQISFHESIS